MVGDELVFYGDGEPGSPQGGPAHIRTLAHRHPGLRPPLAPQAVVPISPARAVVGIRSRAGIKAEQVLQKFPLKDSFSRFSFENKFITTSNRKPVAVGLITSRPGLSN